MTPEVQAKLAVWRAEAAAGTLTLEQMKEAIQVLRQGRKASASSEGKARSKVKAAVPSADDMLGELGSL